LNVKATADALAENDASSGHAAEGVFVCRFAAFDVFSFQL
jgi:hypothetical protein